MSEANIKKEHIQIVSGGKVPVAEVKGGETYIDACVEVATRTKHANLVWSDTKTKLRQLADEARNIIETDDGVVGIVHMMGTDGNYLEINPSSRRKNIPEAALDEIPDELTQLMVTETTEVVLKGEAAKWFLQQNHKNTNSFGKKEIVVKNTRVLVPDFEAGRRIARAKKQPDLPEYEKLGSAGIFAPSVEAKKK